MENKQGLRLQENVCMMFNRFLRLAATKEQESLRRSVETLILDMKQAYLEIQPVDAVEVVHGHWIEKPTGAYGRWQSWCSACGKHSGIGGIESNRHKPYCPNCGARMDGKSDG